MPHFTEKITQIKKTLEQEQADGWLFYDFRGNNDLACNILEIPPEALLTRRFFYLVPIKGEPIKFLAAIEEHALDHLPGNIITYKSWREFEEKLKLLLKDHKKVAMEYSPHNTLPNLSKLDAGTSELIKDCGVDIVSSAPFLHLFMNRWDKEKIESHLFSARVLERIAAMTWNFIESCLQMEKEVTEYTVQQFILKEIEESECKTEYPPICAVNANSALPHYQPTEHHNVKIRRGDFILIDLWCKQNKENAVYADISQVAVANIAPTKKQIEIFNLVNKAQDAALELIKDRFQKKIPIRGCEVDNVCRKVITDAGYGDYFTHRTGHNIDDLVHGSGTNMDDFETHDQRTIQLGSCFSIEPGIYLPGEFGMRTEFDICIDLEGNVLVTGGRQKEIICISQT